MAEHVFDNPRDFKQSSITHSRRRDCGAAQRPPPELNATLTRRSQRLPWKQACGPRREHWPELEFPRAILADHTSHEYNAVQTNQEMAIYLTAHQSPARYLMASQSEANYSTWLPNDK